MILTSVYFCNFSSLVSSGTGTISWSDCSFTVARLLEKQYQRGVCLEVCKTQKWNSFGGFYEDTKFVHDLEQMTELNKSTKVQRPLRRCMLSAPLSQANSTAEPATETIMQWRGEKLSWHSPACVENKSSDL